MIVMQLPIFEIIIEEIIEDIIIETNKTLFNSKIGNCITIIINILMLQAYQGGGIFPKIRNNQSLIKFVCHLKRPEPEHLDKTADAAHHCSGRRLKNGWFRKEIPNRVTLRQIVINLKLLLYNFIVKMLLILTYSNIQMVDQSQYNCML